MPTRVKKNKKGCFPPPRIGSAGLWRSITVINFHHHPRTDKRKSNKSPDQFSSQEYIKNTILILIPRTKNTRTNWIELDQPINITIHTSRTLVASLFTNQQLIQNSSTRLSLSSSHDRRWSGVAKSRVTRSTSSSMVVVIFCPRGGGGGCRSFPCHCPPTKSLAPHLQTMRTQESEGGDRSDTGATTMGQSQDWTKGRRLGDECRQLLSCNERVAIRAMNRMRPYYSQPNPSVVRLGSADPTSLASSVANAVVAAECPE